MAREVAAAETKRFGRAAGLLSVGVGSAGLLTYVYFSLGSSEAITTRVTPAARIAFVHGGWRP